MSNQHNCPHCDTQFKYSSNLKRHLEKHLVTGDWFCVLCSTICSRMTGLNLHWQNSCPEIKSVFCEDDRKSMSSEDLREAAFRLTLDRYTLWNDDEETGNCRTTYHDDKSIISLCVYCHLYLPCGTMNTHYGVHTSQNIPGKLCTESAVSYVCDLCGYGFRFLKTLYKHWRHHCSELLTHFPPLGMDIDNRQLKTMVAGLVRQAEVVVPYEVMKMNRDEETEKQLENDDDDDADEDEEARLSFISRITPPVDRDRYFWNIGNHQEPHPCLQCHRKFHSLGRLDRHNEIFHQSNKQKVICELCQVNFSHRRILLYHLRNSCKVMRIEIPDNEKRKKMSIEELMKTVRKAAEWWKELLDKKKAANIKFIQEFIDDIDKKRRLHTEEKVSTPVLHVPMPKSNFVIDQPSGSSVCIGCKIVFKSPRFLYQHQQLVHGNQQGHSFRTQLTITASSLLPYFKLQEAIFYDSDGNEYRMGKFLEKGKDLAKHLKDRIVCPGTKVFTVEENDCFVMELLGGDGQYISLNHEEFPDICKNDGTVKKLFSQNPKDFDDLPTLEKCV